jgi:ribokinase
MNRVVVVGSINLDRTIRVDHLPVAGETLCAIRESVGGGGKGANAAVASALTGAPTSLVACVGSDAAARIALAELIDLGIDTSGVSPTSAPTGTATVLVDNDGQNCIVVVGGANEELTDTLVTDVLKSLADVAVVLTNLEIPDRAVLAAAEAAVAHGATLIVNPAPARALPDRLLDLKPILTPNQDEVTRLTGASLASGALRLHDRTNAPVIVTVGREGALLAHDGRLEKIAAPCVVSVDTTGAGDVFNGSLAGKLACGEDLETAARFAVEQASLSTCNPGARARSRG